MARCRIHAKVSAEGEPLDASVTAAACMSVNRAEFERDFATLAVEYPHNGTERANARRLQEDCEAFNRAHAKAEEELAESFVDLKVQ